MVQGESCYYVASTSSVSSRSNSRRFCHNLGADLAVIKSMDENQFLYDLLRNTRDARAGWIGLLRRADKKFYWIDNCTKEVSYEKWHSSKPNNFGGVKDSRRQHRMTAAAYHPVVMLSANA